MDSAVHESLSPFQVPWWRWTVITASVAALGVLLWLGSLPRDLQARDASWELPCVLAGFWLVYMARPVRRRLRVFWLARAPGMEAEGPFTVAQLVALWKLGQITAEGLIQPVSAENGTEWVPLSRYADAWDASLAPRRGEYLARNGAALLIVGLVMAPFTAGLGLIVALVGLVLWIVGRSI